MGIDEKKEQLIRKLVFWRTFQKLIDREVSHLSKFLLQQDLIFFEITQFLVALKLSIQDLLVAGAIAQNITEKEIIPDIKIPYPKELLKSKTLGQIIDLFEQLAPPMARNTIKLLRAYNTKRNDLVHRIFLNYDSIEDVYKDANAIIAVGEKVLIELAKLEAQLEPIWKRK